MDRDRLSFADESAARGLRLTRDQLEEDLIREQRMTRVLRTVVAHVVLAGAHDHNTCQICASARAIADTERGRMRS